MDSTAPALPWPAAQPRRAPLRRALGAAALALLVLPGSLFAQACPVDAAPRSPGTQLLALGIAPEARAWSAAELAALPVTTLTQRQTVAAAGSSAPASERSLSYAGPLLRDLLLQAGYGGPNDRAARFTWVEAVATDGYRATFSWGELFNSPLGDQVLVIRSIGGQTLDAAEGPLALRSLADLRPGPRHVRNLCALVVHRLGGR